MNKSTLDQQHTVNQQVGFNSQSSRFMYSQHFFRRKTEDKLKSEILNREEIEWVAMQGLSTGAVTLGKTDHEGELFQEELSLGIPPKNKFGLSFPWEKKNKAKPLSDLENITISARNNGNPLQYFLMRKSDFMEMRNAKNTSNEIKKWSNVNEDLIITLDVINQYLIAKGLPAILVLNPSVYLKYKGDWHVTINPWQRHRVVGIPHIEIGEMAIVDDKPYPILDHPDALYYLQTDSVNWDS